MVYIGGGPYLATRLIWFLILPLFFNLAFIMGKDIFRIYKHSQFHLPTLLIKEPVILSSAPQTSSFIELTITSVSSVIGKKQSDSVFVPKILSRNI